MKNKILTAPEIARIKAEFDALPSEQRYEVLVQITGWMVHAAGKSRARVSEYFEAMDECKKPI